MTRCCWLAALAMLLGFIAPANAKTPVLQLILTPKTATAAGFGPLVNCFSITPDGIVVVGNESHLWAVGAAGALPLKISGLTSFAFMPGGILLGVDGHQLVYLDTDGTLKTLFSLPEPGMSVVPSQGNTLILFGPEAPGRYGLYLLHQGRQATKILQLPASIEDVAALNKTLLFISGG